MTVIDKHKLKALLKDLIEQSHYQAVGVQILAKRVGEETHYTVEKVNAEFDRMHELLDEAIRDAPEGDESE